MTYNELCKSLGIDREAITKACADPVSISVGKEQRYFKPDLVNRHKPPIKEDLSRLIDAYGQRMSKLLRKPPITKPK